MTRIKLNYVLEYVDCHGKVRRLFSPQGMQADSTSWRPRLRRIHGRLSEGSCACGTARNRSAAFQSEVNGCADYLHLKSDAFTKALAPETQRMRRNILDRFNN